MEEEEEVGAGVGDSVGDSGSNLEDANWARLTSAHIPQSTSLPHGTHFAARVVSHRVHLREDRRDFRKVGADVAEFEILLPSSKELWDDVPSSGTVNFFPLHIFNTHAIIMMQVDCMSVPFIRPQYT